VTEAARSSG